MGELYETGGRGRYRYLNKKTLRRVQDLIHLDVTWVVTTGGPGPYFITPWKIMPFPFTCIEVTELTLLKILSTQKNQNSLNSCTNLMHHHHDCTNITEIS